VGEQLVDLLIPDALTNEKRADLLRSAGSLEKLAEQQPAKTTDAPDQCQAAGEGGLYSPVTIIRTGT
jgi:hypothetical protein